MNIRRERSKSKKYYIVETMVLILVISSVLSVTYGNNAFVSYFVPNSIVPTNLGVGMNRLYSANLSRTGDPLYDEAVLQVLPPGGFQSNISLGDSIIRLVQDGVINPKKFESLYQTGSAVPQELRNVLTQPSDQPIRLTRQNANVYLNLLWPLGLSNYMQANDMSPLNGSRLYNFSSTAGWTLGNASNGGFYFNKFRIVSLTLHQEAMVTMIAQNTYRPCCNNPTFFQDCNHGSALLGLLELGASQGLTENELYREALTFNSFWFPQVYVLLAVHFGAANHLGWSEVDPRLVMSHDFSSLAGFYSVI